MNHLEGKILEVVRKHAPISIYSIADRLEDEFGEQPDGFHQDVASSIAYLEIQGELFKTGDRKYTLSMPSIAELFAAMYKARYHRE